MGTTLGENIRKYRKNSGFTQEELARQLNLTAQAISRWESGAGMPDITFLVPLSRSLGVTLDLLFDTGETSERLLLTQRLDAILKEEGNREERYLQAYRLLREAADRNPSDFALQEKCVEGGCYVVKYAKSLFADRPGELRELVNDCARKANAVARYSGDRALTELVHSHMGWTYEFTGEYDKARQHIMELPTYESVQMRESMLAQLELFESGFPAELERIHDNMEKLSEMICNELERSMMDIGEHGTRQEAAAYESWVQGIAEAFQRNEKVAPRWKRCSQNVRLFALLGRGAEGLAATDDTEKDGGTL